MSQIRLTCQISKVEPERQLAFGWLYVAETADGDRVVDHSGEWIEPADLELAAYEYVLESRVGGELHTVFERDEQPIATLVESIVFTREKQAAMGLEAGAMPVGWWVGFKVFDDQVWQRIKAGELRMFSIGGSALRTPR